MTNRYMQGFKCENCSAPLDMANARNGVIQCPVCKRMIPVPDSNSSGELLAQLSIADRELDHCDFSRAYEAYKKATEIAPSSPLAYFGKALAKSQIQYLKDEANDPPVMRPICHQISRDAFTENEDYLKAIKLAGDEQSAVLRARGREIDKIQETFYELQKKGVDYDVFISAKISRQDGTYTDESHDASRLYSVLKDKGIKPFYSENELYKFTGSDYEAHILYALTVCTSMVLICYDEDYLETPWVKNEYMRYSEMIEHGKKAKDSLVVCYKGECIDKLPHCEGKVEGIDYSGSQGMMLVLDHVMRCRDAAKTQKEKQTKIAEKTQTVQQLNDAAELQKAENEAERLRMEQQKESEKIHKEQERQEQQRQKEEAKQQRREQRAKNAAQRSQNRQTRKEERAKNAVLRKQSKQEARSKKTGELVTHEWMEVAIHIFFGVLELAGLLFMISYPNTIRIFPHTAEFTAYVAVSVVLAVIIIAHLAFTFKQDKLSGLVIAAISLAFQCAASLFCFLIGWYCGSMDSWIWVYFVVSIIIIAAFIWWICPMADEQLKNSGFSHKEYKTYGNATSTRDTVWGAAGITATIIIGVTMWAVFAIVGGWLYNTQVNYADGFSNGLFYDILDDGSLSVFVYEYDSATLEIPGEIDGRFVSQIGAPIRSGGNKLKHVTMQEGVQRLSDGCFKNCVGLEDVVMANSVREVGEGVFEGCSSLTKIQFSEKLNYISAKMFKDCVSLSEIEIPSHIQTVGDSAFEGCYKLATVNLSSNLTDIGNGSFKGCFAIIEISLPDSVERLGDSAFENCLNLKTINLSQKLTSIGKACFKNCSSIESISFPDSLIEIGNSAFGGCNLLKECIFPEGSKWDNVYSSWGKEHREDAFSWDSDINTILSFLKGDHNLSKKTVTD